MQQGIWQILAARALDQHLRCRAEGRSVDPRFAKGDKCVADGPQVDESLGSAPCPLGGALGGEAYADEEAAAWAPYVGLKVINDGIADGWRCAERPRQRLDPPDIPNLFEQPNELMQPGLDERVPVALRRGITCL